MKYIDMNGHKKHADSSQDKLLKLLYTRLSSDPMPLT